MTINLEFALNFLTAGRGFNRDSEQTLEDSVRLIILNVSILFGLLIMVIFGTESLVVGRIFQAFLDLIFTILLVTSFVLLRVIKSYLPSSWIILSGLWALIAYLVYAGGENNSGIFWIYAFPLLTIFILGFRAGALLSGALGIWVIILTLLPGLSLIHYPSNVAARIIGVYLLVLASTMVYEQTRLAKERSVQRLARALQAERDEMAAMKDNLADAVFLMDEAGVIQPLYSRSLEKFLGLANLQDRHFPDLLAASLTERELGSLKDYLGLIIEQRHDVQMLADINPLGHFTYRLPNAPQNLRHFAGSFSRIRREDARTYLLGTLRDETEEVILKEQLATEAARRNEDMQALFEIVHIEPGILHDFIQDTEHEFERINGYLKDKRLDSAALIGQIFQSIHAIKSNAIILGLDSLASKLQVLEQDIKLLSNTPDLGFSAILKLTVHIETIQQEKDRLQDLIRKIVEFRFGEGRIQQAYVLVRTCERVIERISADTGKRAQLVVDAMEIGEVDPGPRRLIKDLMVQLIRNAMVHGIEDSEIREKVGKPIMAKLRLALTRNETAITLRLSDDGAGLDFARIKTQALRQKRLSLTDANDRQKLLQLLFSPGFSTESSAHLHAGQGVGLSLVRDRVREAGGSIKLQSDDGKGTTFVIRLPASFASSELRAATEALEV
jgi:two-component system chemotaxis sensor kinase CheA